MGELPPLVIDLREHAATDPELTGAKAANIARCASKGLPTMAGFALTTSATVMGTDQPEVTDALRQAYEDLVDDRDNTPVVVRSSSTIEDGGSSSMAGQFTSVLDVLGWDALVPATRKVIASADAVRDRDGRARPIAVLVQLQLDAPLGGVMFGVDPVTGNPDQIVVEAVPSRPDTLVGGEVTAAHYVLNRRGRIVERQRDTPETALAPALRKQLVRLAADGAQVFGGPQDIEWAVDRQGRLVLLQSRPVTAIAPHGGRGHVFGPGPVAETFPDPLSELEVDLFTAPLRNGIIRALQVTGAATDRQLARSPVLTTLDGRVAVDLELLGVIRGRRQLRQWINPANILRRLGAAWRVGRARTALPALAAEVVHVVDDHLAAVPDPADLEMSRLIDLLDASQRELETTHAYEILAGMLLPAPDTGVASASVAIDALRRGRSDGLSDGEIVARSPEVLALLPPAVASLPPLPPAGGGPSAEGGVEDLAAREALRLRCRWLQELAACLALELGRRLADAGRLRDAALLRHLTLGELRALSADGAVPPGLAARAERAPAPQLPDAFRLTSGGQVLPTRHRRHGSSGGIPAGGGRVVGTVRHRIRPGTSEPGVVLVTRHLEPQLAPLLPGLGGLVAETGSALSHLAILAREYHVPTVVGVADALVRFPPGTRVLVDGSTGEVRAAPDADASPVTAEGPT